MLKIWQNIGPKTLSFFCEYAFWINGIAAQRTRALAGSRASPRFSFSPLASLLPSHLSPLTSHASPLTSHPSRLTSFNSPLTSHFAFPHILLALLCHAPAIASSLLWAILSLFVVLGLPFWAVRQQFHRHSCDPSSDYCRYLRCLTGLCAGHSSGHPVGHIIVIYRTCSALLGCVPGLPPDLLWTICCGLGCHPLQAWAWTWVWGRPGQASAVGLGWLGRLVRKTAWPKVAEDARSTCHIFVIFFRHIFFTFPSYAFVCFHSFFFICFSYFPRVAPQRLTFGLFAHIGQCWPHLHVKIDASWFVPSKTQYFSRFFASNLDSAAEWIRSFALTISFYNDILHFMATSYKRINIYNELGMSKLSCFIVVFWRVKSISFYNDILICWCICDQKSIEHQYLRSYMHVAKPS